MKGVHIGKAFSAHLLEQLIDFRRAVAAYKPF